jgi:hypothetical protein
LGLTHEEAARAYRRVAAALGHCSFLPGSWDKRFARDLAAAAGSDPEPEFSEAQRAHLLRLAHKYRRQLGAQILEVVLDLAQYAADRRVGEGKGAFADFRPTRARRV